MKKTLLIASTAFLAATFSYAGGEGWMNDFEAAKKKAADEKKDLLIDFTGSDWCPPCQDLDSRILSQDSFKTTAEKNYILVELDFPNDKSKVTPEIAAQNEKLAEAYAIQGFPTIILTDAQGRPFGQSGHFPGTPEEYLTHLAELQKVKTARDAEFAKAEKTEGLAKAKALYAGLQAIPAAHLSHYNTVIEAIKANDPKDETGLVSAAKAKEKSRAQMTALEEDLTAAMATKDINKAIKLVDEFIANGELEGLEKQQILAIKINFLIEQNDFDGVEKVVDKIIAIAPENEFSGQVKSFKENQLQSLRTAHAKEKATEKTPATEE